MQVQQQGTQAMPVFTAAAVLLTSRLVLPLVGWTQPPVYWDHQSGEESSLVSGCCVVIASFVVTVPLAVHLFDTSSYRQLMLVAMYTYGLSLMNRVTPVAIHPAFNALGLAVALFGPYGLPKRVESTALLGFLTLAAMFGDAWPSFPLCLVWCTSVTLTMLMRTHTQA